MKPSLFLLVPFLLATSLSAGSLVEKWKLEYDNVTLVSQSDGIEIWELETPECCYFASSLRLPFRLSEIQEILRENQNYPKWVPNILEVEELEKTNDNSWLFYHVTNAPWPFKDRQSIVRMTQRTYDREGWKLEFTLGNYPGYKMQSNRETLEALSAYWIVTPSEDDFCEVGYVFYAENGGGIPDAIELPLLQKTPVKNLIALQHYLENKSSTAKVVELAKVR